MKKFFYLSGLPRSGSTLLAGILGQNKNFHVSGTSGILGILINLRNHWSDIAEFAALDPKVSADRKVSVMRGALQSFYENVPESIVIDKCRAWPAYLEIAKSIFKEEPKVIVTVRDVRDVLASLERLWRLRKVNNELIEQERLNPIDYQSVEGRCNVLMSGTGLVGGSASMICDAVVRGWKNNMHFVEYDDLCSDPKKTIQKIYNFLEVDSIPHDFNNVVPSITENDTPYGWGDLHTIRPIVKPNPDQWKKYIPTHVAMKFSQDAKFWRNL